MYALEGAVAPIHPLLRYLRAGYNVLPLAVGQKEPYLGLIDGWKRLQRERVSEATCAYWISKGDPKMGVGLVCGKISDLCCLDADLKDFAAPRLGAPADRLTRECEQAVRNYDPCISCATHFLDVRVRQA